jgi:prevent-host-death family protein
MATKRIPLSEARQNLTSIVDEVERSGRAVTIRRGKAAAVIIDPETYNQFVETPKREKWMLKGSIVVKSGVNIDQSLTKANPTVLWEDVNEARTLPFDDPFDCLIAGTAIRMGMPLITKDAAMCDSGLLETIW